MNCINGFSMNLFKFAFILLVIPSYSTASPGRGNGGSLLSKAEIEKLGQLIVDGDDPDQIIALLGSNRLLKHSPTTAAPLRKMIELNRFKSLESLIPLIDFVVDSEYDSYVVAMRLLLEYGLKLHRKEICYYLCSWDFIALTNYSYGDKFWLSSTMDWTVPELVELVSRRPHAINFLTPQTFVLSGLDNAERGLMLLEFLHQSTFNSGAVLFRKRPFEPTKMLRHFVVNNVAMADADMAKIITRLIEVGAVVNQFLLNDLMAFHPNYELSIQAVADCF